MRTTHGTVGAAEDWYTTASANDPCHHPLLSHCFAWLHQRPRLLPWLTAVWPGGGLRCWQQTDRGWGWELMGRGLPQGDPLAAWLFALFYN